MGCVTFVRRKLWEELVPSRALRLVSARCAHSQKSEAKALEVTACACRANRDAVNVPLSTEIVNAKIPAPRSAGPQPLDPSVGFGGCTLRTVFVGCYVPCPARGPPDQSLRWT